MVREKTWLCKEGVTNNTSELLWAGSVTQMIGDGTFAVKPSLTELALKGLVVDTPDGLFVEKQMILTTKLCLTRTDTHVYFRNCLYFCYF